MTSDPENPLPFERPPSYTKLEDFVDDLFMNVTDEGNMDGIMDSLRKGIPVDDVAQLLLFKAVSSGQISTDIMLQAIEPTVYMLIGLGEFFEIEGLVLYPEDEMQDDDTLEGETPQLQEMQACIVDGRPEILSLEDLIHHFVEVHDFLVLGYDRSAGGASRHLYRHRVRTFLQTVVTPAGKLVQDLGGATGPENCHPRGLLTRSQTEMEARIAAGLVAGSSLFLVHQGAAR